MRCGLRTKTTVQLHFLPSDCRHSTEIKLRMVGNSAVAYMRSVRAVFTWKHRWCPTHRRGQGHSLLSSLKNNANFTNTPPENTQRLAVGRGVPCIHQRVLRTPNDSCLVHDLVDDDQGNIMQSTARHRQRLTARLRLTAASQRRAAACPPWGARGGRAHRRAPRRRRPLGRERGEGS